MIGIRLKTRPGTIACGGALISEKGKQCQSKYKDI
jgi:hypothetical protein